MGSVIGRGRYARETYPLAAGRGGVSPLPPELSANDYPITQGQIAAPNARVVIVNGALGPFDRISLLLIQWFCSFRVQSAGAASFRVEMLVNTAPIEPVRRASYFGVQAIDGVTVDQVVQLSGQFPARQLTGDLVDYGLIVAPDGATTVTTFGDGSGAGCGALTALFVEPQYD